MNTQTLISKVRELKELQQMANEVQAEITKLQDELKAELTERGTNEMAVDVFMVRWTPVITNRLDTNLTLILCKHINIC